MFNWCKFGYMKPLNLINECIGFIIFAFSHIKQHSPIHSYTFHRLKCTGIIKMKNSNITYA